MLSYMQLIWLCIVRCIFIRLRWLVNLRCEECIAANNQLLHRCRIHSCFHCREPHSPTDRLSVRVSVVSTLLLTSTFSPVHRWHRLFYRNRACNHDLWGGFCWPLSSRCHHLIRCVQRFPFAKGRPVRISYVAFCMGQH